MPDLRDGKMPLSPTLRHLHSLAKREAAHVSCDLANAFVSIGLGLYEYLNQFPLDDSLLWQMPINVSTFAMSGGDIVDYSLLHINGHVTDESPVVMTVPKTFDNQIMIVGENLLDFLCLGCQIGYRSLDVLTFSFPDVIEELLHSEEFFIGVYGKDFANDPHYQEHKRLLDLLTSEFNLTPLTDPEAHLLSLQEVYMPRLEIRRREDLS